MKKSNNILIVLFAIYLLGCKERFEPPVTSLPTAFLVVEGVLNVAQVPTTIHVTRTSKLDQSASVTAEHHALLTVEGEDNTSTTLFETGDGYYGSNNLNLTAGNQYRLRIRTIDGKEYLSDYVRAKITPEIDSISWKRNAKGVQIYANSHDPSDSTRYYRWEYDETWEQHSAYTAFVIYENGAIRPRHFPEENVYACWKDEFSTRILLANSLRLESDIISEAPLILIPVSDERLLVRYSILVRQYALSEDAYNFFEIMKKNSEDIGSIFSPQPSEIKGNIHCLTNPEESVVGFITASTITEKRIFISFDQVPPWPNLTFCETKQVPNIPDSILMAIETGLEPYYHIQPPPIDAYKFSTPFCVDCTTRGGTTTKPSFW